MLRLCKCNRIANAAKARLFRLPALSHMDAKPNCRTSASFAKLIGKKKWPRFAQLAAETLNLLQRNPCALVVRHVGRKLLKTTSRFGGNTNGILDLVRAQVREAEKGGAIPPVVPAHYELDLHELNPALRVLLELANADVDFSSNEHANEGCATLKAALEGFGQAFLEK